MLVIAMQGELENAASMQVNGQAIRLRRGTLSWLLEPAESVPDHVPAEPTS